MDSWCLKKLLNENSSSWMLGFYEKKTGLSSTFLKKAKNERKSCKLTVCIRKKLGSKWSVNASSLFNKLTRRRYRDRLWEQNHSSKASSVFLSSENNLLSGEKLAIKVMPGPCNGKNLISILVRPRHARLSSSLLNII